MPRPAGRSGEEHIIAAAVDVMARHGYHGSSIRDIAQRAGLSSAALYHYFSSKQDILVAFMTQATQDHYRLLCEALQTAGDAPADRLAAVVRTHVLLHTERRKESFVGNSELRSLEPRNRAKVVALRDRIQRLFDEVVRAGVDSGDFGTADPAEAARAVVVMGNAVASWYSPNGGKKPSEVADTYVRLALSVVGAS